VYRVGTLILHKDVNDDGYERYNIVDGQQRTITFSLLLYALYELEKPKDRKKIDFLNQQVFNNQFSRHILMELEDWMFKNHYNVAMPTEVRRVA